MNEFSHISAIRESFEHIFDPRSKKNKQHLLIEVIVITICAVICGAEGWESIETFAKARKDWLRQFLLLPRGIPKHDTYRRIFARLNPEELQKSFRDFIQTVFTVTDKQVIAIDGKSLRRSYESSDHKAKGMIHMVSAWAAENALVLGQIKTEEKSNEITAIPALLKLLVVKGCIVTIDAMGCQRKIAEQIIKQEGDYILAVKENQGKLYEAMEKTFETAKEAGFKNMVYEQDESLDCGHDRIETRRCTILPLMYLYGFKMKWKGLQNLILIESQREIKEQIQTERRYYISSASLSAKDFSDAIRSHWGIENRVHWVMDVVFREDDCRIRKGFSAENLSVVRHIALNLLRSEKSDTFSIKKKRYLATLDQEYLKKILSQS